MEYVLELAKKAAAEGEVPVGAAAVRTSDGLIAGTGRNTSENSRYPTGHAEITAINSAAEKLGGRRLHGCTLYVTLEPCAMCAGAIINARFDRLVFGAYDSRCGACGSVVDLFNAGLDCRTSVTGGILREECAAVMTEFFSSLRRKKGRYILTPITADDQIRRACAMSGIPAAEIGAYEKRDFIRRRSTPIGLMLTNSGGIKRMIIFNEYKNADIGEIASAVQADIYCSADGGGVADGILRTQNT